MPGRCRWELLASPGPQPYHVCAGLWAWAQVGHPSCKAWGLGCRVEPVCLLAPAVLPVTHPLYWISAPAHPGQVLTLRRCGWNSCGQRSRG